MATHTVSKEFFEEKYRANSDPWDFASSRYELNRYGETMRLLGGRTFDSGFEPGHSPRQGEPTLSRTGALATEANIDKHST